jgi:hypothetical protein
MTSRRTFLTVGVAGGVALGAAWWWRDRPAFESVTGGVEALTALDRAAPALMAAIVPILLEGALPSKDPERRAAVDKTIADAGHAIAGLPPAAQQELGELFALLGFAPTRIALARVMAPWSEADPPEVAAFLERWRTSGFALFRSAYDALHQIVLAAWYGNPSAWAAIGYPGPPELSP